MVSVIIPCYNGKKVIETAFKSLELQNYKDFEVIVVNDGSTDNSQQTIEQYMESSDLKIRLFNQKNSGVSVARNFAIEHCEGEYITFLDADDAYEKTYLEQLVCAMEEYACDAAMCQYQFVNEIELEEKASDKTSVKVLSKYEVLELYRHKRVTKINFVNVIYKKEILKKYEIKFQENLKYGEDSLFFCTYLFYCDREIRYYLMPLYQYRDNPTSAMHKVCYERVQTVEAFKRVADLWKQDENFDKKVGNYMIDRAIWAVAKDFAIGSKDFFMKFYEEYDVKKAMKNMVMQADELQIRVTALVYLISPLLFQVLIKIYKRCTEDI